MAKEETIEERPVKVKPSAIEVAQVATATEKMFKLPNGEIADLHEYLVWLGNELVTLKKGLI